MRNNLPPQSDVNNEFKKDHKYVEHLKLVILKMKDEICTNENLLYRGTADIIGKYIPEFANDRSGIFSMLGVDNQEKIKEAVKKYPDFWSFFNTLSNRFRNSIAEHEMLAEAILNCKTFLEADKYSGKLQQCNDDLLCNFYSDFNKMLQNLELKLKSVCQPEINIKFES